MSETTNLDRNHDMSTCPFGCGSAGKHNQSIYAWECGSNCLRLVADGSPIKGDLVRTQLCRLLHELADKTAKLEAAERDNEHLREREKEYRFRMEELEQKKAEYFGKWLDEQERRVDLTARLALAEERAKRLEEGIAKYSRTLDGIIPSASKGSAALLAPAGEEGKDA